MPIRKGETGRAIRGRELSTTLPPPLSTRPEAAPSTAAPTAPSHEQMLRELHEPKLTVSELARLWRVHEDTVWRDIRKGALPAVQIGEGAGKKVLVLLSDARKYGRPYDAEQASDRT